MVDTEPDWPATVAITGSATVGPSLMAGVVQRKDVKESQSTAEQALRGKRQFINNRSNDSRANLLPTVTGAGVVFTIGNKLSPLTRIWPPPEVGRPNEVVLVV